MWEGICVTYGARIDIQSKIQTLDVFDDTVDCYAKPGVDGSSVYWVPDKAKKQDNVNPTSNKIKRATIGELNSLLFPILQKI